MRIAMFTDSFYPEINGVAVAIRNTGNVLCDMGHTVKLFAPQYGKRRKEEERFEVERYFSIPLKSYKDVQIVFPNYFMLFKSLNEFEPHVIHVHTFSFLGIAGILYARMKKIPLVGTFHTLATEQLEYISLAKLVGFSETAITKFIKNIKVKTNIDKRITWQILRSVYDRCDLVISPSEAIKRVLREKSFKRPIAVVSNGINLGLFPKKEDYRLKNKVIFVGRLSYEKNIHVIIDAMKIVDVKYPAVEFVLAGDGPDRERLEGLGGRTRFIGPVPYRELYKVYQDADIFVTASTMETQGLSIIEALACGCPVVGVRKYAIPDVVKDGRNGFLVKPFDSKAMAAGIIRILGSRKLREEMGRLARIEAEGYELKRCAGKLLEEYLHLIGS